MTIQVGDRVEVCHNSTTDTELPIAIGARGRVTRIESAPKPCYQVDFGSDLLWCYEEEIALAPEAVRVWPWADAPQHLKGTAPTNGDEDWLAFVPQSIKDNWAWWPTWLTEPWFGNRVHRSKVDGDWIVVSCHA